MTDAAHIAVQIAEQARQAAAWIAARGQGQTMPKTVLVTGSGLGALADGVRDATSFATTEVPHWPRSTVEGHAGRIVIGTLAGLPILVMQGRVHFYEGYAIQQVTFPVRVLQALGVQRYIVTNAAGGLEPTWNAGDIMLIRDHINLPGLVGNNPLFGPNDPDLGARFPAMENAYSPRLRALAQTVAAEQDVLLREGIYIMASGPSYETPAELRFLRTIGGHAVGMSTAPEVVVARHAGMEVLGLSLLTNIVHLDPDPDDKTDHAEVLAVGSQATPRMIRLLEGILAQLADEN